MIRSILLALDTTEASTLAQHLAIRVCQEIASRPGACGRAVHVTGVAVVDRPSIERPEPAPIGGGAFKVERDEAMLAHAHEKLTEILDRFEAQCRAAGIPCSTVRAEGLPYEQIQQEARSHDLIMIGKDTNFHFETSTETGDTVRRLLKASPRPVVVVPATVEKGTNVVIAYDGSLQSSHALHLWTLLDLRAHDSVVHLVSISVKRDEAELRCQEAATLLSYHDIEARTHPIESDAGLAEVIEEHAAEWSPKLVVMGAYGVGGIRAAFFGSETRAMLESSRSLLFLAQ